MQILHNIAVFIFKSFNSCDTLTRGFINSTTGLHDKIFKSTHTVVLCYSKAGMGFVYFTGTKKMLFLHIFSSMLPNKFAVLRNYLWDGAPSISNLS